MPASEIDRAVARLRDWLEDARAEAAAEPSANGHDLCLGAGPPIGSTLAGEPPVGGPSAVAGPEPGLLRLMSEFTALRQEVKLNTKSGRAVLEEIGTAVAALRDAMAAFRAVEPQEEHAARSSAAPVASALADLDESLERAAVEFDSLAKQVRLSAAADASQALQSQFLALPRWRRWAARPYHAAALRAVHEVRELQSPLPRLADALCEGLRLIRDRLARVMRKERLERIACVGRPVDPEIMNVASVVAEAAGAPGTVLRELRRGYLFRGKLLRCAEVQAVASAPVVQEGPLSTEV